MWTHSICVKCWYDRNPERRPVLVLQDKKQKCCFCGAEHVSGIFVRHNPKELLCKGKHEEEE